MNKRLKKLQEEETEFRSKKKGIHKITFICILLCIFAAFFVKGFGLVKSGFGSEKATEGEEVKVDETWKLILVNADNLLPEDFTVTLQEVPGGQVDERISKDLLQMISDAKQEDVTIKVCSAYRSVSKQTTLFDEEKQRVENNGTSTEESEALAAERVNLPGASEHHTGLAVDFLTVNVAVLDTTFADTKAYEWLDMHAKDYGFVERYPEGKEEMTGIIWEPWHFRYVGVENAKAMEKDSLVLEEYVEKIK